MSIITNWWPDPRFRHTERFKLTNCKILGAQPGDLSIQLVRTAAGISVAALDLTGLPSGYTFVIACRNNIKADLTNACLNVFDATGVNPLINDGISGVPVGGGVSGEFTIPSDGRIQAKLRAPGTVGGNWWLASIFLGTPLDYRNLVKTLGADGVFRSFAGDTRPTT